MPNQRPERTIRDIVNCDIYKQLAGELSSMFSSLPLNKRTMNDAISATYLRLCSWANRDISGEIAVSVFEAQQYGSVMQVDLRSPVTNELLSPLELEEIIYP